MDVIDLNIENFSMLNYKIRCTWDGSPCDLAVVYVLYIRQVQSFLS